MRPPDRRLRQLVVHLSTLELEDVAAVLSELSEAERHRVELLLRELTIDRPADISPPLNIPAYDVTLVSPWLLERLAAERSVATTERSVALLRDCASRLYPAPKGGLRKRGGATGKAQFRWGRTQPSPERSR